MRVIMTLLLLILFSSCQKNDKKSVHLVAETLYRLGLKFRTIKSVLCFWERFTLSIYLFSLKT